MIIKIIFSLIGGAIVFIGFCVIIYAMFKAIVIPFFKFVFTCFSRSKQLEDTLKGLPEYKHTPPPPLKFTVKKKQKEGPSND